MAACSMLILVNTNPEMTMLATEKEPESRSYVNIYYTDMIRSRPRNDHACHSESMQRSEEANGAERSFLRKDFTYTPSALNILPKPSLSVSSS
jgi:hypothetical protein